MTIDMEFDLIKDDLFFEKEVENCVKRHLNDEFDTIDIYKEITDPRTKKIKYNKETVIKIYILKMFFKMQKNMKIKCVEKIRSLDIEEPKDLFRYKYVLLKNKDLSR